MELSDQQIVAMLRSHLSDDIRNKYDDDELLNIIDMIFDYYEDNGMLDIDFDDSDDNDPDVTALYEYVKRMLKKDKFAKVEQADVEAIVDAQLAAEEDIDA